MSKSKGNIITVDKLNEMGYSPLVYKFFCLQSHYRNTLVFSEESINGAKNAYNSLIKKINSLNSDGEVDYSRVEKYINEFKETIGNDLNTAGAISILFDVLKSDLNDATKLYLINDFDKVFCLNLTNSNNEIDEELLNYINEKIKERNEAKSNKDYAKSDLIRDELKNKGIILKDTREGTTFELE